MKPLVEDGIYTKKEYLERKRKHEKVITVKRISLNETNIDIPEFETCYKKSYSFYLPKQIHTNPIQKYYSFTDKHA